MRVLLSKGAPNGLLIMTDDSSFGTPGAVDGQALRERFDLCLV